MDRKKAVMLYLRQLFEEKTDETHFLRMSDILSYLELQKEIKVDRRTVYDAIKLLDETGFHITGIQEKGNYKYTHSDRLFSKTELKFLIDAAAGSKFLTEKESKKLIAKVKSLGSEHEAKELERTVFLAKRVKSMNETVFWNLDNIYEAMAKQKQISFKYVKWTSQKKLVERKAGSIYTVSPYAVILNDDNYYLVAYDAAADRIKHYRIDKMKQIKRLDDKSREGKARFESFNLVDYSQKMFGMYGGKEYTVKLECKSDLAGVIIDRFGKDVWMHSNPRNPEIFTVSIAVQVSPQFYGWLFGLGKDMKIISPEEVKTEYIKYIEEVRDLY